MYISIFKHSQTHTVLVDAFVTAYSSSAVLDSAFSRMGLLINNGV